MERYADQRAHDVTWQTAAERNEHEHSVTTCAHDSEGPSIWWLCGYEPMFTPPVLAKKGQS
jgi:hypothetical protein